MKQIKIITVLGARPQFVKAAVLSNKILIHNKKNVQKIDEKIIHTGQHYDTNMSQVFFEEMSIPKPHFILESGGKSHANMTGDILIDVEKILKKEQPDYLLVYGDTNSTLAGALAASKIGIKIIHIEAGLRSFNRDMPEEINRLLTDHISSLLFCPTKTAVENLKREGITNGVHNVGDIMFDGIQSYLETNTHTPKNSSNILVTIHRQENTENKNRLISILKQLNDLSKDFNIVFPVHPRTKKLIDNLDLPILFKAIEPLGYSRMLDLINDSNYIITDSGGLQKEAFFMQRKCLTLRNETEWVETVENKNNVLVDTFNQNLSEIIQNFQLSISNRYNLLNAYPTVLNQGGHTPNYVYHSSIQ